MRINVFGVAATRGSFMSMTGKNEIFISVDIESSGPIPGEFSLLTIGACEVFNSDNTFSISLKPITPKFDPEALAVTGLSLEQLEREGISPVDAMMRFRDWVINSCGANGVPVFVGFNAAFDWSFVNYYFHKFLNENPFGFSALDIKSMYMGAFNSTWRQTKSSLIDQALSPTLIPDHEALKDAQYQAEIFRILKSNVK